MRPSPLPAAAGPFAAHAAVEAALGDPDAPGSAPLSFASILAHDEAERFPEEAHARLHREGFLAWLVPAELGGRLASYEELWLLNRAVSRRDVTLAVAVGQTYLGAAPVWVAGTASQRTRVAAVALAGLSTALALTEREHGSDLLACETRARRLAAGFVLTGEKWLINNGTRGRLLAVLARTGEAGPRGLSLFLVDREPLPAGQLQPLPREATLGIRGADISGFRLRAAVVPANSLIGGEGGGLAVVLRTLQVSRVLCTGFSLGAADTCLRRAVAFSRCRRLYGRTVWEIPAARRALAEAYADLLAAEAAGWAAVRAIHRFPEQLSVWSAVAKVAVPALVEDTIAGAARVFGARHYLRGPAPSGVFQKMQRDAALIGLFDGSAAVNLQAIALQLRSLLRRRPSPGRGWQELWTDPLPPVDLARLDLTAHGRDALLEGFLAGGGDGDGGGGTAARTALAAALARLAAEVQAAGAPRGGEAGRSAAAFALARRFCCLHVAVAAAAFAAAAPGRDGAPPGWLAAVVGRLLSRAGEPWAPPEVVWEALAERLALQVDGDRLLSIAPAAIAGPGGGAPSR